MSQLVQSLGLDWRLLLSQAVNFLLLLALLRYFAYTPIMNMMKARRARIEEGLAKATEADHRLDEANQMAKDKMHETETQAIAMMRATEDKAKKLESHMLGEARKKEAAMLASAELAAAAKEKEMMAQVRAEAQAIVKQAIVRTVEMAPHDIDDTLVKKAVAEAGKSA